LENEIEKSNSIKNTVIVGKSFFLFPILDAGKDVTKLSNVFFAFVEMKLQNLLLNNFLKDCSTRVQERCVANCCWRWWKNL